MSITNKGGLSLCETTPPRANELQGVSPHVGDGDIIDRRELGVALNCIEGQSDTAQAAAGATVGAELGRQCRSAIV